MKDPLVLVKVTVPVGVDGEGVVSVTTTVQVAAWPTCIGFGVQLTTMGAYVAMFVVKVPEPKVFQANGRTYPSSKCEAAMAGSVVTVV